MAYTIGNDKKTNSLGLSSSQYNEDGSPKTVDMYKSSNTTKKKKKKQTDFSIDDMYDSQNDLIEKQADKMYESQESALGFARENALRQLEDQSEDLNRNVDAGKTSAVAGAKIAQKRLADLIPFTGAMMGSNVRQAEGIETGLQQRQSDLDNTRLQGLEDIASSRLTAEQAYQAGLMQARAGADATMYGQQLSNLTNANNMRYNQAQQDEAQARQMFMDTIGQYGNDYQAQYNIIANDGDPSNDWQLGYIQSARQNKLEGMDAAESSAAQQQREYAESMLDMLGYASGWVAEALGVPEGTTTMDYMEMQYNINKPYYKSSGGSSGSSDGSGILGTNNPEFQSFASEIYLMMNSDPALASSYIQRNKDAIIAEVGKTGYNELLRTANDYIEKDVDTRKLLGDTSISDATGNKDVLIQLLGEQGYKDYLESLR